MKKFKVGDKVIYKRNIVSDDNLFFETNLIYTITKLNGNPLDPEIFLNNKDLFVCRSQVELVVDKKAFHREPITKLIGEAPVKHNKDKAMMSLVRPEFIKGIAEGLTFGYIKYDEKRGDMPNYLKGEGFYYSEIIDSLQRHLNEFQSGESIDKESGLSHLALAAVNLMFLHTYEIGDKGVDDRTVLNEKK